MPYLVEQLFSKDIIVEYDETRQELSFQMDVTIGKGDPSDQCPPGFLLDRSGMYCNGKKWMSGFVVKIHHFFVAKNIFFLYQCWFDFVFYEVFYLSFFSFLVYFEV